MRHAFQISKIALFAGLFIIVIGTSAWQIKTNTPPAKDDSQQLSDTTRPGAVHPDQIDLGVNTDSIMKAAETAVGAIDFKQLQQQINASLANINFDEINKNIANAMKNVDWEKMKMDVSKAMDEAKVQMAKVNEEQVKASLEKAKAELKQVDLSKIQNEVATSMAKARTEIEKSRTEIADYRNFVAALQNDGLIKAGEPYKIELKDNVLYINGVQQSKATTEKYRKFYQDKTHFSIYDNKGKENGTDL